MLTDQRRRFRFSNAPRPLSAKSRLKIVETKKQNDSQQLDLVIPGLVIRSPSWLAWSSTLDCRPYLPCTHLFPVAHALSRAKALYCGNWEKRSEQSIRVLKNLMLMPTIHCYRFSCNPQSHAEVIRILDQIWSSPPQRPMERWGPRPVMLCATQLLIGYPLEIFDSPYHTPMIPSEPVRTFVITLPAQLATPGEAMGTKTKLTVTVDTNLSGLRIVHTSDRVTEGALELPRPNCRYGAKVRVVTSSLPIIQDAA